MVFADYTWVFALATIVAFACAFGIGANDVANSFSTSVGAKALTIFQAVVIAGVCEFLGASLLGASVTDTIKNNIAKTSAFAGAPAILMFGMFCVMITAAFWDNLACQLELPVSTTHTTVGAVVGMAVSLYGFDAVIWCAHQSSFPYIKGMVPIFLSWVISPICAGICVSILYGVILRPFVLRSKNSFQRAYWFLPVLVGLTFFVIVVFIIQTGNKNKTWDPVADGKIIWIGFTCAGGMTLLTMFGIMPFLKRNILAQEAREQDMKEVAVVEGTTVEVEGAPVSTADTPLPDKKEPIIVKDLTAANEGGFLDSVTAKMNRAAQNRYLRPLINNPVARFLSYGSRYNVHDVMDEDSKDFDARSTAVWENAEVFDVRTERLFRYLQVFSAAATSLAHGANDVANAVGPYSAVYNIWVNSTFKAKSTVPEWILVLGGAGIVCGLAIFGYKIMRVLGVKTVKLSNSRGFCAELSTAIVVLVASRYGLPISTTQVITGALITLGLFEGRKGVNWRVMVKIIGGWILTILVAAFVCAGLSSFVLYAPNKMAARVPGAQIYG